MIGSGKGIHQAVRIVAATAFVLAWLVLGPARLGGSATYLMVSGTSMLPGFRAGDLVIVRRAEHYGPGDVVAYRNRELGIIVLHRILRLEGDRYVFKGDNNGWEDRYRPGQEDLIGKLWLHLPGMGDGLRALRTPRFVGILLGVMMMGAMFGEAREQQRQARRRMLGARQGGIRSGGPALARGVTAGALLFASVLLLSGALALAAFRQPLTRLESSPVPYTQEGTFTYSATVEKGPVYDDGSVDPGDAVFSRLVPKLGVTFDYHFGSGAPHSVRGTGALRAVVTGASGWRYTLPLQPEQSFEGDRLTLKGTLDVAALGALVAQFLQATGLQSDQLTLTVVPDVRVSGQVAGQGLAETFAPALEFQLMPLAMSLKKTGQPETDPLHPVAKGMVQSRVTVPNRLRLLRVSLDVETARRVAAAGVGAGAAGLIACLVLLLKEQRKGEALRIRARYGAFIIDAEALGSGETQKMVRVTNMESLVKLAVQYERLILHEWRDGQHWYVVQTPEATYCYRAAGSGSGEVGDQQPA